MTTNGLLTTSCRKTMAAEAIGFDLGRPLLVVNVAGKEL